LGHIKMIWRHLLFCRPPLAAGICAGIVFAAGCRTHPSPPPKTANTSGSAADLVITDNDVRLKAEEYLRSGLATTMASALRMAREFYWPQKQDPEGIDRRLKAARERSLSGPAK
jgi:hypothetical protein